MISFTVHANPIAQPRPRAFSTSGRPRIVSAPSRHPVIDFKASCRLAASVAYDGPPLDCAVSVRIGFVMPRPKYKIWKTKPMPSEPHDKKPDLDNLAKAVLDSLNALIWRDDSLISDLFVSKRIAAGDEQPHVSVVIEELVIGNSDL